MSVCCITYAHSLKSHRIPLGYWSVPLTSSDTNGSTSVSPYTPGAWPYLLQALNWAKSHNIHVILDIHGAPGSQNGYDNSGERTSPPLWGLTPANVSRTIDTVKFIAENIGGMIDVLELLNEPAGWYSSDFAAAVRQFWLDGYAAVRAAAGAGIKVMIGDAFLGVQVCFHISMAAVPLLMCSKELDKLSLVPYRTGGDNGLCMANSNSNNTYLLNINIYSTNTRSSATSSYLDLLTSILL